MDQQAPGKVSSLESEVSRLQSQLAQGFKQFDEFKQRKAQEAGESYARIDELQEKVSLLNSIQRGLHGGKFGTCPCPLKPDPSLPMAFRVPFGSRAI